MARIVAAWLSVGQNLSESQIETLREKDGVEAAYQRSLTFISYRPRSEAEVRRKMQEQGVKPEWADEVVERLMRAGVVGDTNFAAAWVENRAALHPRGRRLLTYELRQKGISDEDISTALEPLPEEEGLAYNAGVKYASRLKGLEWMDFSRRLTGFLARRGFSYSTCKPVIRQIWDEFNTN
ncbi:MAG TPA: regulatory protein RecX [Longilinea sp.]|nr:regulatory protein RecX [Longilinea sp.]